MKYLDDDDLLTQVLKWLPVDELFELKCVCKRWNKFISSKYFRTFYLLESPWAQHNATSTPLGFYVSHEDYAFLPTSLQSRTNRAHPYFKTDGFYIIDSSNGLVLFHNYYKKVYRVCNPVNKQSHDIPEPPSKTDHVAIAFNAQVQKQDSDIRNSFVLMVLVMSTRNDWYHLYTRLPGASNWTEVLFHEPRRFVFSPFQRSVVIKGIYYWLSFSRHSLFIYGLPCSDDSSPFKFISLPGEKSFHGSSVLGESKDGLLQYAVNDLCQISTWVLNYNSDDHTESRWINRYTVCYGDMYDRFPECDVLFSRGDLVDMQYDKVMVYHPSTPETIFLFFNEIIISYCFHSRRLELVGCKITRDEDSWHPERGSFRTFPFGTIVPYFSPTWAASFL